MLLLVCFALIVYLASVGIPRFVLDKVERLALQQGIELKIDSARLGYGSGLSFLLRDIDIALEDKSLQVPHLSLGRVRVGLRVSPLLHGEVKPYLVIIKRGKFNIPCSKGGNEGITISDINVTCAVKNNDVLQIVSTTPLDVEGIKISLKADLLSRHEEHINYQGGISTTLYGERLSKFFNENQSKIQLAYDILAAQHWGDSAVPRVSVSYNNINTPRSSFTACLPNFKYENFEFNDINFEGAYSNDSVTIHKLQLHLNDVNKSTGYLKPAETKLLLQGSYDLENRKLAFILNSDMPLLSMASDLIKPEDFKIIERVSFSSKEHAEIRLQGDIDFDSQFEPNQASVLGYLQQKNIRLNDSTIDELVVSFFYQDGNFAIDQAQLKIGDGYISAESSLKEGAGQIEIDAKLTLQQLRTLANAAETDEFSLEIPQDLSVVGAIDFHAEASMLSPDFQIGKKALNEFLPEIESLKLALTVPQLTYSGIDLIHSKFIIDVDKLYAFATTSKTLAESVNCHLDVGEASFKQMLGDVATKFIDSQISEGLELMRLNKNQELRNIEFNLNLAQILFEEVSPEGRRSNPSVEGVSLAATAQGFKGPLVEVEQFELNIDNLEKVNLAKPFEASIKDSHLVLEAREVTYKDIAIEYIKSNTSFESLKSFEADLHVVFNQSLHQSIQTAISLAEDGCLRFTNIQAEVPSDFINAVLPSDSLSNLGLSLDNQVVKLDGEMEMSITDNDMQFLKCGLNIDVPSLVKNGVKVKPFKEISNALAIKASIDVHRDSLGSILFNVPHFSLIQDGRSLTGSMESNESGVFLFAANSTLLLSTIDHWVDDHLAHLIMRDFSMDNDSQLNITDMKLTVDVRDGLVVQANTHVDLSNVEALLGTYERVPDPDGTLNQEDIKNKDKYYQLQSKINQGHADVVVDLKYDAAPKGEKRPLSKAIIEINNATMVFDNRPWLEYKKIKGGASTSKLTARSIVLDTKNNFVGIHDTSGTVYPDYSIGTFFAPLRNFLEVLSLKHPVKVETHYCQFPIHKSSKVQMDGAIAMSSDKEFILKLLGLKMPINQFSGFIDFQDKGVYLDRLNGIFCEGVADARVLITLGGESTGYDGELILQSCNLEKIAELVDNEQSRAFVNSNIRFRSNDMRTESLEAYGHINITEGDLLKLRIFSPIADMINNLPTLIDKQEELINSGKIIPRKLTLYEKVSSKVKEGTAVVVETFCSGLSHVANAFGQTTSNIPGANYLFEYNLRNASADFVIGDGVLSSQNLYASGSNLAVNSSLHIDLKRMYIQANLWPRLSSLVSLMLSPITVISDGIIDINLHGTFDDLSWNVVFSRWNNSVQDDNREFLKRANRYFDEQKSRQKSKQD